MSFIYRNIRLLHWLVNGIPQPIPVEPCGLFSRDNYRLISTASSAKFPIALQAANSLSRSALKDRRPVVRTPDSTAPEVVEGSGIGIDAPPLSSMLCMVERVSVVVAAGCKLGAGSGTAGGIITKPVSKSTSVESRLRPKTTRSCLTW